MKLISQNSLGKTDYLGTLEFCRSSTGILADVEAGAVRNLVVSLGDALAERDPHSAIAFLAESPSLLRRMPAGTPARVWSYFFSSHDIMPRSRAPTSSIRCSSSRLFWAL